APWRAVELDIGTAPAEAPPVRQRQILHAAHADAAIDRDAFGLHEAVVRHRRPLEGAVAGVLAGGGLVPVHLVGGIVHAFLSSSSLQAISLCGRSARAVRSPSAGRRS